MPASRAPEDLLPLPDVAAVEVAVEQAPEQAPAQ